LSTIFLKIFPFIDKTIRPVSFGQNLTNLLLYFWDYLNGEKRFFGRKIWGSFSKSSLFISIISLDFVYVTLEEFRL